MKIVEIFRENSGNAWINFFVLFFVDNMAVITNETWKNME